MHYIFEWNDLRALSMILNVLLIIIIGLPAAWFGLAVAIIELITDIRTPKQHINLCAMHIATMILNIYFLTLL